MAKVIPQDVFSVPFNKQFIMFLDYFYSFEVSRYEIKHCQLKAPVAYRCCTGTKTPPDHSRLSNKAQSLSLLFGNFHTHVSFAHCLSKPRVRKTDKAGVFGK